MKLIIDIPDEVLKSRHYCRYFGAWSTKLTETIENGIPYEERPKGEWIENTDGYFTVYTCNKCNGIVGENDKFCGHCGAEKKTGGAK